MTKHREAAMIRTLLIVFVLALGACKSAPDEKAVAETPSAATTDSPATAPDAEPAPAPPVVVTDAEAEHRTSPNGKAQVIKFATGKEAFFGKLVMEGGGKVPVHRDATEEYIYILEGSGKMNIDGKQYDVGPNTAIYMPANAEVSFEGGPDRLVALQVFAGPGPAAKYDGWQVIEPPAE